MYSDSKKFWQKIWQNKFNVDFLKGVRILVSKYCQKTAKFKGETNCMLTRITDDTTSFFKSFFLQKWHHMLCLTWQNDKDW